MFEKIILLRKNSFIVTVEANEIAKATVNDRHCGKYLHLFETIICAIR